MRSSTAVVFALLLGTTLGSTAAVLGESAPPNEPLWVGDQLAGLQKIRAKVAWGVSTGSSSVKVAVVDTGMQLDHPDLAPNYRGRGYYVPCTTGQNDLLDRSPTSHGTHLSGIIGAVGNNYDEARPGTGAVGVAWSLELLVAKRTCLSVSSLEQISLALNWAVSQGIDVANNSWFEGGAAPADLDQIVTTKPQILFVFNAGGTSTNYTSIPPGMGRDNAILVAASTNADALLPSSAYGALVDIAAPGENVWSTKTGSGIVQASGTSQAAALVSGCAALLKAIDHSLTGAALKQRLKASAQPVATMQQDVNNPNRHWIPGGLRLDCGRAATMTRDAKKP